MFFPPFTCLPRLIWQCICVVRNTHSALSEQEKRAGPLQQSWILNNLTLRFSCHHLVSGQFSDVSKRPITPGARRNCGCLHSRQDSVPPRMRPVGREPSVQRSRGLRPSWLSGDAEVLHTHSRQDPGTLMSLWRTALYATILHHRYLLRIPGDRSPHTPLAGSAVP